MEDLIREGALRLLTSEASCDVILSCRGRRLMAHKVILSMASPVLQDILLQDNTVPTVIIFPDISSNTMSLILDYIYSGSVNVRSDILIEFLSAANELKLQIDTKSFNKSKYVKDLIDEKFKNDCKYSNGKYETDTSSIFSTEEKTPRYNNNNNNIGKAIDINNSENKRVIKKYAKKMPALVPISTIKRRRTLQNHIIPSPWCPRVAPLLADPRENNLPLSLSPQHIKEIVEQNDTNNNFRIRTPIKLSSSIRETSPKNNKKIMVNETSGSSCSPTTPSLESDLEIVSNNSINLDKNNSISLPLDMKKKYIRLEDKDTIERNNCRILDSYVNIQTAKENNAIHKPASVEEIDLDNDKLCCTKRNETAKLKRNDKKPFNCEDCGKSFSQLRNFKYHRSIHEGTKEFSARCPECGKLFNDKGYLSSHMKIHRDRKEYGCPHCPKRFNQRVAYNMHLRIHTGVKPHECPTCGKTFSRKMLLKQHQRVHTGERPYSCPECGKSFADRSNMSLHARLHTGVKPYTCNLCSKSFTKKHHLKTHMNFHTGLKPYSCQKCGLAFSQSSNMRTHYKKCILKPSDTSENENS